MFTATAGPSLPPEFAPLGACDQVFDLARRKTSERRLLAVLCGISLLGCLLFAVPLLACGIKPFGTNAPSRAVCFSVGGVFGIAGLALAWGAIYFARGGRPGAGSFHLFRDCLVVVRPGQEIRQIAWDRIGPEKEQDRLKPRHVYPVNGEAYLDFDFFDDHDALATEIARRTGQPRWCRLLTPALAGKLVAGRKPPAFLLHDPSDNGLYRVAAVAGHLLFMRVGDGCAAGTRGIPARPMPTQGGLAGAAAGWARMKQLERLQQALDVLEAADERRLFEIADSLDTSRLVAPEELVDLHFDKPSTWGNLTSGAAAVAVLKFTHAEWGAKKMFCESLTQLGDASRLLQEVLGRDFRSEILEVARA
jgi:hypothetical protein